MCFPKATGVALGVPRVNMDKCKNVCSCIPVSRCIYIPYHAFANKCSSFRPIREDWQIDFATGMVF